MGLENDRDREIDANYKKMMRDDEIAQKVFGEIRDPAIKAKLETDLRHRLGQWYDTKKELGGAEEDFTLRGKHRSLAEQLSIDIDRIIGGSAKANERLDGKPEKGKVSPEEEYNPNDFEWRFRNSMKDHREKLVALSPEQRKEFEIQWREKFAAHEKRFTGYLNDHDKFSFEGLTALIEEQEADLKQSVDETCTKSRAEKLRDDLKAKMPQGQKDHDRGR